MFTETAEDLEVLVDILQKEGVVVQRPKVMQDPLAKYDMGEFDIEYANQPLQPRDILGFYGNKIIEAYTKDRTRYFENWNTSHILKDYHNKGAEWISMPKPNLNQKTYCTNKNVVLFHQR